MNGSRTVDQIEKELDQEEKLMFVHQKNGNYADAEVSRLKIEQLHKDHQARSLHQMNFRHKQQQKSLIDNNNHDLANFNDFWNKRQAEIKHQEQKSEGEMFARHKTQISQARKELQLQNSPKLKESSQLLNLRRMEEHMVKQKNFAEAHKVQAEILQMEKSQKGAWLDKRDQKIETALSTLKGKQNVQLTNLKKRYKTLLDQSLTDRKIQEERLLFKHSNLLKDMKNQQEKQILNYKGQFKSRGGRDSPMRTRTSFHG